jgi:hypothetical protein
MKFDMPILFISTKKYQHQETLHNSMASIQRSGAVLFYVHGGYANATFTKGEGI